jgi:Protein of unknown function (DUF998)
VTITPESNGLFEHSPPQACSTDANVTRSLLGYLALAGPFYVVVSLVQALARTGFSLSRDEWSLLALGHFGWIQVVNLVTTGAMTIAGAVGVRRALGRSADAGVWAPRLLVGYGIALIAAGIFRADPSYGFPPGSPTGASSQLSWHATLHILSGSIGFGCLIALCFVFARRYGRLGRHGAAMASRLVGAVFAIAFAGIATGATGAPINLGFTAAVVASYAWMTAVAVDLYRRTRVEERQLAPTNQ